MQYTRLKLRGRTSTDAPKARAITVRSTRARALKSAGDEAGGEPEPGGTEQQVRRGGDEPIRASSRHVVEDGGLSSQGDEECLAVEDEHEGVRQEEQPDEGVGTGEAIAAQAPEH